MKKSRFTEEKIIEVLKQLEAGRKVSELSREYGVSTASIYAWKSKYAGLEVSQLKRLKELEEENRKLKTLVADLSLDKVALPVPPPCGSQQPRRQSCGSERRRRGSPWGPTCAAGRWGSGCGWRQSCGWGRRSYGS